jgi:hypothetical protein
MVKVLAWQAAIAHTKLQLKRQGHRVNHYPHREIVRQAEAHLDANRERLIAETPTHNGIAGLTADVGEGKGEV